MAYQFPRCRIVPQVEHQVSLRIDDREVARWCHSPLLPRPCFFPVLGPSGTEVTRIGHPGAPNHDHHRSVWFAHAKVMGIDFWSDTTTARIEQRQWLAYQDGDDEAVLAVRLAWIDGHDPRPLLEQDLVAAIRPLERRQWMLELQATFRPTSATLEFQKTNFGFLAVRVAKHLSAFFGGGELTGDKGARGEKNLFGKPSRWIDYSGPSPRGGFEGITYIDHPQNPGQPTRWHVREDGWMGASPCMDQPQLTTREKPLRVRFLLLIHADKPDAKSIERQAEIFASSSAWEVVKSQKKHHQFEFQRST